MVKHLLSCADRFDTPRLRSLCEVKLVEQLEVNTVCEMLVLADSCHATQLQARPMACLLLHGRPDSSPSPCSSSSTNHRLGFLRQAFIEFLLKMAESPDAGSNLYYGPRPAACLSC